MCWANNRRNTTGVDDCEGELEENSKATFDINNHECNVTTDTG
jgi:hypothetical protein